jgi:hypothetical protein
VHAVVQPADVAVGALLDEGDREGRAGQEQPGVRRLAGEVGRVAVRDEDVRLLDPKVTVCGAAMPLFTKMTVWPIR